MKMKWIVILTVLAILLAGCSATDTQPTEAIAPADSALSTDGEDALPLKNLLMLGIIRLQDSDQAIMGEQSKEMLTLWQAYRAVTSTGDAATEETEALLKQIQEGLTPEQIATINDMHLTNDDLLAFYEEVGIAMPTPVPGETPRVSGSGGGKDMSAEEKATRQAERQATGDTESGTSGTDRRTALVDRVIEVLDQAAD